jgi:hypothetical protein
MFSRPDHSAFGFSPNRTNNNNNAANNFNLPGSSPVAFAPFATSPTRGSSYVAWLEERLIVYLCKLKLQPTLSLTHFATGKTVEVKTRPVIRDSYHLETERYEVVMYFLDNLADLEAIHPSSQQYSRTMAERLGHWLGWPVTFNAGQWGVIITVWLRSSPEQLRYEQQQQQRQSRNRHQQGQAEQLTSAGAGREGQTEKEKEMETERNSRASSSQFQTQTKTTNNRPTAAMAESLPTNLDFYDYVNLETCLQDRANGNGSVIPALCFGLSRNGPVKHRLTRLKHLAIAGPTGSGKSGVLRSLLAQVLLGELFETSQTLVALVDLERVTFNSALFEGLPQVYQGKVLTEQSEVSQLFKWLAEEKEWRASHYNLSHVEDLDEYNRLARARGLPVFPTILVMIEEASELAAVMRESLTRPLESILNTGRKFGIFVVLAGQRFHNDTIPSGAKNQCATRLALGDCDAQTLRILEFNTRQHRLSHMTEGRGLLRLAGEVSEVQGLNLPKPRFIDLINQLRGRAGLAVINNEEKGWFAPEQAAFRLRQSGSGQTWATPTLQSSGAAQVTAATSSRSSTSTSSSGPNPKPAATAPNANAAIPPHAGGVSPSLLPGQFTSPSVQPAPSTRPGPELGQMPQPTPPPVQPSSSASPFAFGAGAGAGAGPVTGAEFGLGAVPPLPPQPQPPLPPQPQPQPPSGIVSPLPGPQQVAMPMPPVPPAPLSISAPLLQPIMPPVQPRQPGNSYRELNFVSYPYQPPSSPAQGALQPQAFAGQLQPLPPGLLGQASSLGLDPLTLLDLWATNNSNGNGNAGQLPLPPLSLTASIGAPSPAAAPVETTPISPGQPRQPTVTVSVVPPASVADVRAGAEVVVTQHHPQPHSTDEGHPAQAQAQAQIATSHAQAVVSDPELFMRTWQAQLQLAEHDPTQQKPSIRLIAKNLGWTFYRGQKVYNEAKATRLIKD